MTEEQATSYVKKVNAAYLCSVEKVHLQGRVFTACFDMFPRGEGGSMLGACYQLHRDVVCSPIAHSSWNGGNKHMVLGLISRPTLPSLQHLFT